MDERMPIPPINNLPTPQEAIDAIKHWFTVEDAKKWTLEAEQQLFEAELECQRYFCGKVMTPTPTSRIQPPPPDPYPFRTYQAAPGNWTDGQVDPTRFFRPNELLFPNTTVPTDAWSFSMRTRELMRQTEACRLEKSLAAKQAKENKMKTAEPTRQSSDSTSFLRSTEPLPTTTVPSDPWSLSMNTQEILRRENSKPERSFPVRETNQRNIKIAEPTRQSKRRIIESFLSNSTQNQSEPGLRPVPSWPWDTDAEKSNTRRRFPAETVEVSDVPKKIFKRKPTIKKPQSKAPMWYTKYDSLPRMQKEVEQHSKMRANAVKEQFRSLRNTENQENPETMDRSALVKKQFRDLITGKVDDPVNLATSANKAPYSSTETPRGVYGKVASPRSSSFIKPELLAGAYVKVDVDSPRGDTIIKVETPRYSKIEIPRYSKAQSPRGSMINAENISIVKFASTGDLLNEKESPGSSVPKVRSSCDLMNKIESPRDALFKVDTPGAIQNGSVESQTKPSGNLASPRENRELARKVNNALLMCNKKSEPPAVLLGFLGKGKEYASRLLCKNVDINPPSTVEKNNTSEIEVINELRTPAPTELLQPQPLLADKISETVPDEEHNGTKNIKSFLGFDAGDHKFHGSTNEHQSQSSVQSSPYNDPEDFVNQIQGTKMSLAIQDVLNDAKKLSNRLNDHDSTADSLVSQMQAVYQQVEAMKQYHEDISQLNDLASERPRLALVAGIQQESKHITDLQQENRELRSALEEQQNAVDMIMSKYREHVSKLMECKRLDDQLLNTIDTNNKALETNAEKMNEMKFIMRKAISTDEEALIREEALLSRLWAENKGLREMLEISRKYGSYGNTLIHETEDKEVQTSS